MNLEGVDILQALHTPLSCKIDYLLAANCSKYSAQSFAFSSRTTRDRSERVVTIVVARTQNRRRA
jgi:hypothetical protein